MKLFWEFTGSETLGHALRVDNGSKLLSLIPNPNASGIMFWKVKCLGQECSMMISELDAAKRAALEWMSSLMAVLQVQITREIVKCS